MMGTMTDQPEFAMRIQASGGMLGGGPNMPMGASSNPMMMRALMSGGGQGLNPMDTYLALGAMSQSVFDEILLSYNVLQL